MREIKFRAWIPRLKKIEEVSDMAWYHSEDGIPILDVTTRGMIIDDSWELMQFTGLKDSKGREIYEGDVVRISKDYYGVIKQLDGGAWYIAHKDVSLKYKYQIHCEICETDRQPFFLSLYDSWELEVIGNIYENPELL